MKKIKAVLFILFFIYGLQLFSQTLNGKVLERLFIQSEILNKEINYSVYLPYDYDYSSRSYPVVYLLHGYTGNETDWVQFGEANRIIDEKIIDGSLPPMIVIMPDGENNWYMNRYDKSFEWEDMFIKEFIPSIENEYRIRKEKQFRAISGLSMGGHGSLILAMRNTELFGACAALSAGVWSDEEVINAPAEDFDRTFGMLYGNGLEGEQRITNHYKENSPVHLVQTSDPEELSTVRYYIDCGDDDFLAIGNSTLHILMLQKKIPHEYRVRDGAHTWDYWRTTLPVGLEFISRSFRR